MSDTPATTTPKEDLIEFALLVRATILSRHKHRGDTTGKRKWELKLVEAAERIIDKHVEVC